MSFPFKNFLQVGVLLFLIIALVSGVYLTKKRQIITKEAASPDVIKIISQSTNPSVKIFEEQFDSNLSSWILEPGNGIAKITYIDAYSGTGSLQLETKEDDRSVKILKVLKEVESPIILRVFFVDRLDHPLNTFFKVSNNNISQGPVFTYGIGVNTDSFDNQYSALSESRFEPTGITRSDGWHMFEIIISDIGIYGKIDNRLLYSSFVFPESEKNKKNRLL